MSASPKKRKAVALLSGGLDSTLAILLVKRLGIDVTALTFLTHFGCDISDSSSCSKNPFPAAERFGFTVKLSHLADKFIEIVKNPKFGHGRNMNPCVDCRILMLREAGEFMRITGADFIVTGEVLGQRPMSQRRDSFPLIDREAGLKGLVLRPLSAKLLPPTLAEEKGFLDRDKLMDISGRGRKPQMRLAEEFGLTDYPNPAGGCLLTEPNYSWRLKELLHYNANPPVRELNLLRAGRHFRIGAAKVIAGRNEAENNLIESLAAPGETLLRAEGCGSPTVLITEGKSGLVAGLVTGGDAAAAASEIIRAAASICARYSDNKDAPPVSVVLETDGRSRLLAAMPADEAWLALHRIQMPEKPGKGKSRITT
ncbi:MAG: thiamine biosynthesis protein [Nitrospiraceae bacterium]|nr:thiamine biosynthesis protein [Nitrospiraceae bacterium]